jgi:hypothetical protein
MPAEFATERSPHQFANDASLWLMVGNGHRQWTAAFDTNAIWK